MRPGASRVVGLYDAMHDLAAPLRHGLTAPGGQLGGGNPAYGIYAAREGDDRRGRARAAFPRAAVSKASASRMASDPSAAFSDQNGGRVGSMGRGPRPAARRASRSIVGVSPDSPRQG